jgi:AraC-like DNA-binding protein
VDFAVLGRTTARTNAIRFRGHEPHRHPVPHLVYVVAGTGLLTVEGRTLELCQGQGAWLPADVEHGLVLRDGGMAIGPTLGPDAVPPAGRPRVVGPVPALSSLVTVLLCAAPEDDDERVPLRTALEDVLRAATREHFPLTVPEHPVASAIARAAARFDGTLDQLAERHFISVRQVQRLFVDETGLTFARWRTRARLNLAIESLRAGEGMRTAMQVSGFATRHGLLKALGRECGVPPEVLLAAPDGGLLHLGPLAA